ncbi:hypothetical protein OU995_10235 [Roseateles sp. SL47]|uniref:hypothetical protein n=1 Tax=Roseateles sp. SL47 TaxID=2995138 RepID=UPI002270A728|nr:hypothetical protein [Roseateles sp. SL47]WAC75043.1 hypothetical protein OU995_10235 [Roseateles sp. SL47]
MISTAARPKTAQDSVVKVAATALGRKRVAPQFRPKWCGRLMLCAPFGVAPAVSAKVLREGTKGTVVADMRVENGKVAEILSLSGPSACHPAVTEAINNDECDRLDRAVIR